MIKSVEIDNFQSHEESVLEFSGGVNVILGPSDSGKTAIIRALRWLVWNRPSGEAFRSNWGGDTSVKLELEDGTVVVLSRSKSSNIYTISAFPETGAVISELKAIKTDVPEEVTLLLNLNEINLQQQLDRPFLLDDSPGEVAQHFSKIANLEAIHRGTRAVQGWLRSLEQDIASGEDNLSRLKEDLEQYDHLEELEGWVTTLEGLEREQNAITKSQSELRIIIDDLAEVEEEIHAYKAILGADEPVERLLKLAKKKKDLEQQRREITKVVQAYSLTQDDIESTKRELNELQDEFKEVFPDVCPLCGQEVE